MIYFGVSDCPVASYVIYQNPINTIASRYITWTVHQLKKELMQRDASTDGKKTDLIERYTLEINISTQK